MPVPRTLTILGAAAVAVHLLAGASARAQEATAPVGAAPGVAGRPGEPPRVEAAHGSNLTGAAAAGPRATPELELRRSTSGETERGGK